MTATPLISVIVPVYNCAKYLPQCVDSILMQTYTHLQIILVNDGSTDGSGQLCDAYAAQDPRITVIHQTNSGVSAARNAGLKAARGVYIGFVDGDDYITPDMYTYLYNLMTHCNTSISTCGFYSLADQAAACPQPVKEGVVLPVGQALTQLIDHLFIWNKLFTRDLLQGISFSAQISYGEDMLFLLDAFRRAGQITCGKLPHYYYRQHRESVTHSKKWNPKHLGFLVATDQMRAYAKEQQLAQLEHLFFQRQMELSVSFLRDCLVHGPFDKESLQQLRTYFKQNFNAFLTAKIAVAKKLFVLCAFISPKLARSVYLTAHRHEKMI